MKPDGAETLAAVILVTFVGLTLYVHMATYGSGGFLVTPSMAGFCTDPSTGAPAQCDRVPDGYVFDQPAPPCPDDACCRDSD